MRVVNDSDSEDERGPTAGGRNQQSSLYQDIAGVVCPVQYFSVLPFCLAYSMSCVAALTCSHARLLHARAIAFLSTKPTQPCSPPPSPPPGSPNHPGAPAGQAARYVSAWALYFPNGVLEVPYWIDDDGTKYFDVQRIVRHLSDQKVLLCRATVTTVLSVAAVL